MIPYTILKFLKTPLGILGLVRLSAQREFQIKMLCCFGIVSNLSTTYSQKLVCRLGYRENSMDLECLLHTST